MNSANKKGAKKPRSKNSVMKGHGDILPHPFLAYDLHTPPQAIEAVQ